MGDARTTPGLLDHLVSSGMCQRCAKLFAFQHKLPLFMAKLGMIDLQFPKSMPHQILIGHRVQRLVWRRLRLPRVYLRPIAFGSLPVGAALIVG